MPDMLGAFESHVLPDGSRIYYRDSDHAYYAEVQEAKNGKVTGVKDARLTSVSTVVAPMDWHPDGLMKWACRTELDGVAALVAGGMSLDGLDGEAIRAALADAALLHTDTRDQAASRGTNVHKHALHALATGRAFPDLDALTEEEQGYALGIAAFWHEHEPEPLQSEQVVFDRELRVVGRFDLRAVIDGKTCLVDAKTGASSFVPVKHHGQLAGYDRCATACGVGGSERQYILKVAPDGTYRLIACEASWEDFEHAVQVYRDAGRITARVRATAKGNG